MLEKILLIIECVLLFYLTFNVVYLAIFSLGGIFYKTTNFRKIAVKKYHSFAILIPAYKHDEVILNTVGHSLNQDYPKDKFDVIVIADSLKQLTIGELLVMPIKLIQVAFEKSTKAKSLNTALGLIPDDIYDYCLVLDVDNIMEHQYLAKINARLQDDQMIIQGHRTAKNLDSPFSILDGLSEEINNHIFRKGHVTLGISAALSGSGQAMRFITFKEAMSGIDSAVEDKELEYYLVRNGINVLYENDALIYDEKVQNAKVFSSQRKRWISSQFFDFNTVFFEGISHLILKGNFNFFNKALQRIVLPRILLLGLSFLSIFIYFIPSNNFGIFFIALFLLNSLSYIFAIPSAYFNIKTLNAALRLPFAFCLMVGAMLKSKGNSKTFVHTQHTATIETKKQS